MQLLTTVACILKQATMFNSVVAIDSKHINGRATDWCLAREKWTIPFEMLRPAIGVRVEKGDQFVGQRIISRCIGTFGGVAQQANVRPLSLTGIDPPRVHL